MADDDETASSQFWVMANGQIESCEYPGVDNLYCKYSFSYGTDWQMVEGVHEGVTQLCQKPRGNSTQLFVWNFPINITFKSTNAFKWPQLAISVYGLDNLGRDVVRGYGTMYLPIAPGHHTKYIRLFKPLSSSPYQQFSAWLFGQRPEFIDSQFVTRGDGREVTRVRSNGVIKVNLNVLVKNMANFGYTEDASKTAGTVA